MNQEIKNEVEKEFDKKYFELYNDIDNFDENGDSPTHYFGYKRKIGDEMFTVLDIARVKGFFIDYIDLAITKTKEEIADYIDKAFVRQTVQGTFGVSAIPETNNYANGWNDCRKEAYKVKKIIIDSIISYLLN